MAKMISIKINVDKINKSRLYKGQKGNYLEITAAINDEQNQFGHDVSVWQGQTKEEREAKKEKNYLGNGKVIWSSENSIATDEQPESDSLPF